MDIVFLGLVPKNEIGMRYHNTEMKDKLANGTMKNYYITQKYIAKFLKDKHHRNDISLPELNYKFILDFETFLSKHQPKDHQKPLNNNGIMKHIVNNPHQTWGCLLR
jgi:hypothetical protein